MNNNKAIQKIWTKHDEQFLIDNKDLPLANVAEQLGRGISSIKYRRQKLGLKRHKVKDLTDKRFIRLVVIRENGRLSRKAAWLCKCEFILTKRKDLVAFR